MTGTECAHCGREPSGYATIGGQRVCHVSDPSLPDCYRRVTVWAEPLGALRGREPLPVGIEGIQRG